MLDISDSSFSSHLPSLCFDIVRSGKDGKGCISKGRDSDVDGDGNIGSCCCDGNGNDIDSDTADAATED